MSTSSGALSIDAARQSMDVLAAHLDGFVQAWESAASPPDLAAFLPEQGEIRRLTLVELIKVDLEYRWLNRNCPKRIWEYAIEFPEIRAQVPCDLIYEEFHIRKQSGEEVNADEYLSAFPGQTAQVASILGLDTPYESSSFYRRSKVQCVDGIAAGDEIDDFHLLAELGVGAFAKVFLARQKSMQRLVALKISGDQGNEPQTLAQLDHDHIVRVYDQRVVPDRKLRLLYMQYVAGGTLQAVVHRVRETPPGERTGKLLLDVIDETLDRRGESRPVDSSLRQWLVAATWPEAVCWLGAKLARALDYAHAHGVLHRDVKPANVLVTAEASPKLADFNISFSDKVAGATPAAYFGGSLAYMSPEQLEACNPVHSREADELDGRSDFYALGVVLWELLTGFRPFQDDDVSGNWSKTLEAMVGRRERGADAQDLGHVPGCPRGLPAIMHTTLTPDREKRWASGLQMARRLELCTDPVACEVLFPRPKSLRVWSRQFTTVIVVVMAGIPNVLAGVFNYLHNNSEIIARLGHLKPLFERTQGVINGVAYPIGMFMFWYFARSVFRGLPGQKPGPGTIENRRLVRRRSLRLGHLCAVVSIVAWSIAACAYPISLSAIGTSMPHTAQLHFFFSLMLCGAMAAAYPFFGITFFCLRCVYPALLLNDLELATDDAAVFKQVGRWAWIYAVAAALVPLLSIAALIVVQHIPEVLFDDAQMSMGVFAGVGLIGLPCVFWLFHAIQTDIETLSGVVGAEQQRSRGR